MLTSFLSFSVILRVHDELTRAYPTLLLILVPRHPEDSKNVSQTLKKQKVNFVLRSTREVVSSNTSIYVVDTLGELRMLYRVTPIAVIGGSFLPGLAGHNISEAAAVGCAVMTGTQECKTHLTILNDFFYKIGMSRVSLIVFQVLVLGTSIICWSKCGK
jgi:3-deoxy-D-manno-octulosonic-acid transferase